METRIIKSALALLLVFVLLGTSFSSSAKDKDDPEKARKEIKKMRKQALKELYELYPSAKNKIKSSNGYAVFGNTGATLLLLATSRGGGIAHNNNTGKDIYTQYI